MSVFRRYDHVERLGAEGTENLLIGTVHVFPKLDGTNGSVWTNLDGMRIVAGSRNREINVEQDNAGFAAHVESESARFRQVLDSRPGWIIYGEWLVPHTLKTYREDAWRKFWVFDVYDRATCAYLPYELYEPVLRAAGFDVLMPLCTIQNPTIEQLRAQVEVNTFLIQDGAGVGEGIVVKNYAWKNRFGAQPWGKIVRNEFKEQNSLAFGTTHKEGEFQVEVAIADRYCTAALVGKTRAKVVLDIANATGIDMAGPNAQQTVEATHRGKVIPQLLGRVWHDLVVEESWAFVKEFKNPTINFKKLQGHVTAKVKEYAKDLFA